MRVLVGIIKKELAVAFSSPIFYAATFIFLVIVGYFFYSSAIHFSILSFQASQNPFLVEKLNLVDMVLKPFFGDMAFILLLMLPLVTMRIYAEEKKTGTIELLFTYPLSDTVVLAGKFLAAMVVLLAMLAMTLPNLILLEVLGNLEWGIVLSGYLGIILFGAGFIAVGIFASSLTENQIVAAVISFGALLLLWAVGWANVLVGPPLGIVLAHISIINHLNAFMKGLIDTRDVVFYLLFTFFWLFLTRRFLSSRFWRG